DLPIDFSHGIRDGQRVGSGVPCRQTIEGFNVIANTWGTSPVTEEEISQLGTHERLLNPQPQDIAADPEYGRQIHLRRHAGPSRLTIFDGGHEGLPFAGCQFLARFARQVEYPA